MKVLLDAVRTALDAVCAVAGEHDAAGMPAAELVAVADALGLLKRRVDAALLPVAAEIARQSRRELGSGSLAKQQGFRTPGVMLSTATGTGTGEAARLVTVGEATAPRVASSGEMLPAKHPHIAEAVNAGTIGTLPAAAIISMLDKVEARVDVEALDAMEFRLVDAAPGLTVEQLQKLILRAEATLDPDGVEPKEAELRAQRTVTVRQDRHGAIHLTGVFDPETGAPVMTAIEGMVTGMLRRTDDGTSVFDTDDRTIAQMRADALSELCRHGMSCEQVPTAPATTVVVRLSLEDLRSGAGTATIDGVNQPISISTARRAAADAEFIPCVLGSESEVLDWGRAKRGYTRPQKLALAERDGGCASCGLPPGFTAAHHIRWWARDAGPTDLGNGVLLCTNCHHRIHDDGWEVRIGNDPGGGADNVPSGDPSSDRDGGRNFGTRAKVWFMPPARLDPARTPRLGGRARYDIIT